MSRAITRTKAGCLTCRRRRVKCDETRPTCRNCSRKSTQCDWPDGESSSILSSRLLSCEACRVAKAKCDRARPECARCIERHEACVYRRASSSAEPPKPRSSHTPSSGVINSLVEVYLEHVWPTYANGFLHKGELKRRCRLSGFDDLLVRAVCISAYRYTEGADPKHPDGGDVPAAWAEAMRVSLADNSQLSEDRLAVLLVMITHEQTGGQFASAWMLTSFAARLAYTLRLHVESPHVRSWLHGELRRRMMWAVFCLDVMGAGGISEYTVCEPSTIDIALPVSEYNYTHNIPARSLTLAQLDANHSFEQGADGVFSRYVRLMALRSQTLKYTKSLPTMPLPAAWEAESPYQEVLSRLSRWKEDLPPQLELTESNLFTQHESAELCAFVTTHLWYEQIHCDLSRICLPGFRESAPAEYLLFAPDGWVAEVQRSCYEHSKNIMKAFELLSSHFPDVVLSAHACIIVWEATRNALTYLKLLRADLHEDLARGIRVMMDMLGHSRKYSSAVRPSVGDLRKLLARSGVAQLAHESGTETGLVTPAEGPVLSRMHWMSRLHRTETASVTNSFEEATTATTIGPSPTSTVAAGLTSPFVHFLPDISAGQTAQQDNPLDSFFEQYTHDLEFPDINPFLSISQDWAAEMLAFEGNSNGGNVHL